MPTTTRGFPKHARRQVAAPYPCSAAHDEDVLTTLVVQRLAVETAVERLQLEPRDVDEPEPFVLGRPPQGAGGAAVERDIDPSVSHRIPDRVGLRFLQAPPIERRREPRVKREGVPC